MFHRLHLKFHLEILGGVSSTIPKKVIVNLFTLTGWEISSFYRGFKTQYYDDPKPQMGDEVAMVSKITLNMKNMRFIGRLCMIVVTERDVHEPKENQNEKTLLLLKRSISPNTTRKLPQQ